MVRASSNAASEQFDQLSSIKRQQQQQQQQHKNVKLIKSLAVFITDACGYIKKLVDIWLFVRQRSSRVESGLFYRRCLSIISV